MFVGKGFIMLENIVKKGKIFDFAIDKSMNMVYNIKLHYNRLICLKMGRDCFGSAVYILILY